MNTKLMSSILNAMNVPLDPPGCTGGFIDHPTDHRRAVEIGVVFQHRFAFHYWLRWRAQEQRAGASPPNLLTIDWHDDVGGDCDFAPAQLEQLNPKDENELSLFCWSRLRSLNDGHIAPAQYLNAIGDVYIILKQRQDVREMHDGYRKRTQKDRHGNLHQIHYFDTIDLFLEKHEFDPIHPLVLDIDLDYFTTSDDSCERGAEQLVSDLSINDVISPDSPLMRWVFPRLAGFTIALEPHYCGGIRNCMHILDVLSDTLFDPPLLAANMQWRHLRSPHPNG
jgi:hypothetical protein